MLPTLDTIPSIIRACVQTHITTNNTTSKKWTKHTGWSIDFERRVPAVHRYAGCTFGELLRKKVKKIISTVSLLSLSHTQHLTRLLNKCSCMRDRVRPPNSLSGASIHHPHTLIHTKTDKKNVRKFCVSGNIEFRTTKKESKTKL